MAKSIKPDRLVFYTVSGREIEYEPISPITLEESEKGLEAEYKERGELLTPPTYTVELAGSTPEAPLTQTFEHDEKSLQTDEDRKVWAKYQDATAKLKAEAAQLRMDIVLSALKISLPEDASWEKKLKKWHITVPEDPDEKLQFYILREILVTPQDIFEAMTQVVGASMRGTVSEEAIEAASATFRSNVQEAAREAGLEFSAAKADTELKSGQSGNVGT